MRPTRQWAYVSLVDVIPLALHPQCPQRAASMRWTSFSVIGLDGDSGKKRGPAEYDRVAKHTRPPQRQGDLRRVIVVDVRDGGERNKLNVSLPIS